MVSAVLGIIVTYNSRLDDSWINLIELSKIISIIICDNSTDEITLNNNSEFSRKYKLEYKGMDGNKGIAFAQNYGIIHALNNNFEFVFLIDDDSCFSTECLSDLTHSYHTLTSIGRKVGALSARAISAQGIDLSNVKKGPDGYTPCSLLTSSGALIPTSTIKEVGLMDAGLFIDYVDFDWGWRAIYTGYELILADSISFQHALGIGDINICGYKLKNQTPIRHYYQTRNLIRMLGRRHVPLSWKTRQVAASIVKFFLFGFFVKPRKARTIYFIRGLFDGIKRKIGSIGF
jgi:rhamnosyltransferase